MQWAAFRGHLPTVRLLIAAGADLDSVNNQGNSALHWAAHNDHVQELEALCQAGACPYLENMEGKSALKVASFRRSFECAFFLNSWLSAFDEHIITLCRDRLERIFSLFLPVHVPNQNDPLCNVIIQYLAGDIRIDPETRDQACMMTKATLTL